MSAFLEQVSRMVAMNLLMSRLYEGGKHVPSHIPTYPVSDDGGRWFELTAIILKFFKEECLVKFNSYQAVHTIREYVHRELQKRGVKLEDLEVRSEQIDEILKLLSYSSNVRFPLLNLEFNRQTTFLEQNADASEYRLSENGIKYLSSVEQSMKIEYAPDVVSMIKKDLASRDYKSLQLNCDNLVTMFTSYNCQIESINSSIESKLEQNDHAFKIIFRHNKIIEETRILLEPVKNDFLRMDIEECDDEMYEYWTAVKMTLDRIYQAIFELQKRFIILQATLHRYRSKGIKPVDFSRIAKKFWSGKMHIASAPDSENLLLRRFEDIGLWKLRKSGMSIYDVPSKLSFPSQKENINEKEIINNIPLTINKLSIACIKYKNYINKQIRTKKELKLSEVIENISDRFATIEEFTPLLFAVHSVDSKESNNENCRIVRKWMDEKIQISFNDGSRYEMNNIQFYVRSNHVSQR